VVDCCIQSKLSLVGTGEWVVEFELLGNVRSDGLGFAGAEARHFFALIGPAEAVPLLQSRNRALLQSKLCRGSLMFFNLKFIAEQLKSNRRSFDSSSPQRRRPVAGDPVPSPG
jgi:hypothetical protein